MAQTIKLRLKTLAFVQNSFLVSVLGLLKAPWKYIIRVSKKKYLIFFIFALHKQPCLTNDNSKNIRRFLQAEML